MIIFNKLLVDRLEVHFELTVSGSPLMTLIKLANNISLFLAMVKRTDLRAVAPAFVARHFLIFIRMIQSLNRGVTLIAKKSLWTRFPPFLRTVFAILGLVSEDFGWPPKISHMMRINTTFRVMRFVPVGAPARLIFEQVKLVDIHSIEETIQVLVERLCVEKAAEHEVVLEADALEELVLSANLFMILESEALQVVWNSIKVDCHDDGSIKSVLAVEFEVLSVKVTRQCFIG